MTCPVDKRKLLYGVGFNDADYQVQRMARIEGKTVREWTCPYYQRWYDILRRCYNKKALLKRPTYGKVIICDEWKTFSSFKAWMEVQDWEGKQLDKDLKVRGSNIYSAETCCFLSPYVNTFLQEGNKSRNGLKVGVSWHKRDECYTSQCYNYFDKKLIHLGYCDTEQEAHNRYLKYKKSLIPIMYSTGLINQEVRDLLLQWIDHGRS